MKGLNLAKVKKRRCQQNREEVSVEKSKKVKKSATVDKIILRQKSCDEEEIQLKAVAEEKYVAADKTSEMQIPGDDEEFKFEEVDGEKISSIIKVFNFMRRQG